MLFQKICTKNLQKKYKSHNVIFWGSNVRTRLYINIGNITEQNEEKEKPLKQRIEGKVVPGKKQKSRGILKIFLFYELVTGEKVNLRVI